MQIVEKRVIYIAISVVLILAGFVGMIVNAGMGKGAFSTDVEFSGGTSIEVSIGKEFENNDITNIVKEATGENNPQVQKVGDGHSVTIKTKSLSTEVRSKLQTALSEKYDLKPENFSIQDVSATISSEMVRTSILSVVVACVFMLVYVSIRFKDFSMGASAILALCHDALIVVGSYAVLRIPLSNSFIAAVLTVLGYSINATIVIFDRIRENKASMKRGDDLEELVDLSITQTLTRTIYSNVTTFIMVFMIFIMGVTSIKEFTLPLMVGLVCGAYSSVCITGAVWFVLTKKFGKKKAN